MHEGMKPATVDETEATIEFLISFSFFYVFFFFAVFVSIYLTLFSEVSGEKGLGLSPNKIENWKQWCIIALKISLSTEGSRELFHG